MQGAKTNRPLQIDTSELKPLILYESSGSAKPSRNHYLRHELTNWTFVAEVHELICARVLLMGSGRLGLLQESHVRVEDVGLHVLLPLLEPVDVATAARLETCFY